MPKSKANSEQFSNNRKEILSEFKFSFYLIRVFPNMSKNYNMHNMQNKNRVRRQPQAYRRCGLSRVESAAKEIRALQRAARTVQ
uniref:Uncharacterized protein n=1 Tax=Globodera rostochiensis TaxID=31243 RepID=A0A914H8A1_GLORO